MAAVNKIVFEEDSEIRLRNGLEYTGTGKLVLLGNDSELNVRNNFETYADTGVAALDGNGVAMITSSSSADVVIKDLEFDGRSGRAQHAFELDVPGDANGTIKVVLKDVEVEGFWDHGIHIDDQAGATGGGGTTQAGKDDLTGGNSRASLFVKVIDSEFEENGLYGNRGSVSDNDGFRVDEGGRGSAKVVIKESEFEGNGADGFELDETRSGDAIVIVRDSYFNNNGPFDLADTDDGLDVDEAGRGDLIAKIFNTEINGNFDEGLDLDEANNGNLHLVMKNSEANNNGNAKLNGLAEHPGGTGVKLSEEQRGDVIANFNNVEANGNDDYGFRLEQFGGGSVDATFRNVVANNNRNAVPEEGGKNGIRLESYVNPDEDGVEDVLAPIDALFKNVVALDNGGAGLRFDASLLTLGRLDFIGTIDYSGTEFTMV